MIREAVWVGNTSGTICAYRYAHSLVPQLPSKVFSMHSYCMPFNLFSNVSTSLSGPECEPVGIHLNVKSFNHKKKLALECRILCWRADCQKFPIFAQGLTLRCSMTAICVASVKYLHYFPGVIGDPGLPCLICKPKNSINCFHTLLFNIVHGLETERRP